MQKLLATFVTILVLALTVPIVNAAALSDVDANDDNYTAIQYLYNQGVIGGYPDGTFQPERTVNRAELAKILVGGVGAAPSVDQYNNCFPDVTDQWFAPFVCYAEEQGWVDGYPDGTFQPNQTVKMVEAVKMVVNSQGYELVDAGETLVAIDFDNTAWYADYVMAANWHGVLPLPEDIQIDTPLGVAEPMVRGEVSEMIYRAMIIAEKDLIHFVDYTVVGPYKVVDVIDGDTIKVELDGEIVGVRLIGVDTPETVHPNKPVQCFGQEASAQTEADLLNQYILLEADESQSDADKYDRLLRYVIRADGSNYNKALLKGGYGFEYTYDNNPYKYQAEFMAAEEYAQTNSLGLWSPNTCNGEASVVEYEGASNDQAETEAADVEANAGGDYKFYVSSYARTKYYCETDSAWQDLSPKNLLDFDTEVELLAWMETVGKELELNEEC